MSGLNELVEFLRARLDEDEAAARSIGELTAYRYDFPGRRRVETRSGVAELDLDQMAPVEPRHTLRILASVYVDHPDYDPTWELPGGVGTP